MLKGLTFVPGFLFVHLCSGAEHHPTGGSGEQDSPLLWRLASHEFGCFQGTHLYFPAECGRAVWAGMSHRPKPLPVAMTGHSVSHCTPGADRLVRPGLHVCPANWRVCRLPPAPHQLDSIFASPQGDKHCC